MRLRITALSGFALATALLLSACSVGASSVPKADVEKQVTAELTKTVGQAPDSVVCPGDLAATVGTTMRCELQAGGSSIGVTVTVTGIDGSTVNFDVVVDDAVTSTTTP